MEQKKEELKEKLLYLALHNFLKKRFGTNRIVLRKDLYCELGRHFLIPRNLRDTSIKELEYMNIIKKIDKDKFKILDVKLNLEKDANRLFELWGIF